MQLLVLSRRNGNDDVGMLHRIITLCDRDASGTWSTRSLWTTTTILLTVRSVARAGGTPLCLEHRMRRHATPRHATPRENPFEKPHPTALSIALRLQPLLRYRNHARTMLGTIDPLPQIPQRLWNVTTTTTTTRMLPAQSIQKSYPYYSAWLMQRTPRAITYEATPDYLLFSTLSRIPISCTFPISDRNFEQQQTLNHMSRMAKHPSTWNVGTILARDFKRLRPRRVSLLGGSTIESRRTTSLVAISTGRVFSRRGHRWTIVILCDPIGRMVRWPSNTGTRSDSTNFGRPP